MTIPQVDNVSSSQIAEAVPGLSFCGLVDQGRVLISLLHVPFPFKIPYQIQVKRAMVPACCSISKMVLKPGKESAGGEGDELG